MSGYGLNPVFLAASVSGLLVVCLLSTSHGDGRSFLLGRDTVNQTEFMNGFALGVHHDSLGRTWTNPAGFFALKGCGAHLAEARTVEMAVFVGICAAAAAVLCLAASATKYAHASAVLFASCASALTVACYFMWSLYTHNYPCVDNGHTQTLQLHTLFRLSYALPTVATCAVLAMVNTVSLKCAAKDPKEIICEYQEVPVLKTVEMA